MTRNTGPRKRRPDVDAAGIPVVILCGSLGNCLREGSEKRSNSLVDMTGKPILRYIVKKYDEANYGTTYRVAGGVIGNADGSFTSRALADDMVRLQAIDDGSLGGPILTGGRFGLRTDYDSVHP